MTLPLVVILAGGEGRRIGGGKPLRTLGGERLIDRAVRIAKLWSQDVRVALREPGQVPGLDLRVLTDDPAMPGPLAGLASALHAAKSERHEMVLTIPCDAPFLPGDLGPRLHASIAERLAALAASGTGLHPTCALWRAEAAEHLPDYAASGRRSLAGYAERIGFAQAEWSEDRFLNVNSEADLAQAERLLSSEIDDLDRIARAALRPGA